MAFKYFISYSRSVQTEIKRLVDFLRAEGHDVWWDAEIQPGQPWWGTIVDKIIWCEIFVFVVSEKAIQSPYCLEELKYATARNRPILPFILDEPLNYKVPPEVTPKLNQWLNYNGDMHETTQQILRASARLNLPHDIYAPRPPEPGKEHVTLIKQFQRAASLARNGYFDEAIKNFHEVASLDATEEANCRFWITKITIYRRIVDFSDSIDTIRRAQAEWQTYITTYKDVDIELFDPLYIRKKFAPRHLVTKMSAEDYYEHAKYRPRDDYDGKIADYTEAIKLDIEFINAYFKRGYNRHLKGNYKEAIIDYNKVIELNPQYTAIYHNRGDSYYNAGEYEKAIADFTQAMFLEPDYALNYYLRGLSFDAIGSYDQTNYDRAIADFTEATSLNPRYINAYIQRGQSHYSKHEYEAAIANFTKVIEIDSQYPAIYYFRGLSYHTKGDYKRAISDYDKFLASDPDNRFAATAMQQRQQAFDALDTQKK